jgi:hypothetical protein
MTGRLVLAMGVSFTMALLAVLGVAGQPVQALPAVPTSLLPGHTARSAWFAISTGRIRPDVTARATKASTWRSRTVAPMGSERSLSAILATTPSDQHSYDFTYASGLRVDDVLATWGLPQRADYGGWGVCGPGLVDKWSPEPLAIRAN